jgi:hypothetical protein
MSDEQARCAFCGHPDKRHRIIDAIEERIATGERPLDVFNDYGWAPSKYLRVAEEVDQAERAAKRRATIREMREALEGNR